MVSKPARSCGYIKAMAMLGICVAFCCSSYRVTAAPAPEAAAPDPLCVNKPCPSLSLRPCTMLAPGGVSRGCKNGECYFGPIVNEPDGWQCGDGNICWKGECVFNKCAGKTCPAGNDPKQLTCDPTTAQCLTGSSTSTASAAASAPARSLATGTAPPAVVKPPCSVAPPPVPATKPKPTSTVAVAPSKPATANKPPAAPSKASGGTTVKPKPAGQTPRTTSGTVTSAAGGKPPAAPATATAAAPKPADNSPCGSGKVYWKGQCVTDLCGDLLCPVMSLPICKNLAPGGSAGGCNPTTGKCEIGPVVPLPDGTSCGFGTCQAGQCKQPVGTPVIALP